MKFILGKKENMTQYFSAEGKVFPATLISAGPIVITKIFTKEKDGYEAVQVGYGTQKESRLSKAVKGQMKGLGNFKDVKEIRTDGQNIDLKQGDTVDVSVFEKGDNITVSGISKGKGFQGVVKRHGFHGGPRTHGQKHSEREPGSIGGSGGRAGGRVAKGIRMAGRMGSDRITVKNLTVLETDKENNMILVKGAIPGRKGTLIEIIK